MKVRKEIARPGVVTYINRKTGKPEKLRITPHTIRYWYDQGNAMRAAGLSIPVPFEHQDEAKPLTEQERAANLLKQNAGWLEKFEIGEVKEKTPDGKETVIKDVLFGEHDILDKAIVDKLPATIRSTSPWITSFIDGAGKQWKNVIGHSALTLRPRLTNQQPFADGVAAALSLIGTLEPQQWTDAWEGASLSSYGYVTGDGKLAKPLNFVCSAGIKLSAEEEEERKKEGEEEMEKGGEVKPPEGGHEKPPADPSGVNKISIHKMIGDLLTAMGVSCPDGMSEATFEEDIYQALMQAVQSKCHKSEGDKKPMQTPANPIVQESPNMYASLSLEDAQKITDTKERSIALSFVEMRTEAEKHRRRAEASEKAILATAKVRRDQRIEAIAKRLKPTDRDALLAQSNDVKLSLADDGTVTDPLDKQLKLLEGALSLIPDLMRPGMETSAVPHPVDGEMTEERRKKIVESMAKAKGHNGQWKEQP